MTKKKLAPPQTSIPLAAGLLIVALAEVGLAVYQWVSLAGVAKGGHAACSVNQTVNCETVWASPFAQRVHDVFGMPAAGLGLVWGLAAAAVAGLLLMKARAQATTAADDLGSWIFAARVVAGAGLVAIAVFGVASAMSGALCLTCLGTYVLVAAYAALAFKVSARPLRAVPYDLREGLKWTAFLFLGAYVAILMVSLSAPDTKLSNADLVARADNPEIQAATSDEQRLQLYLRGLPVEQRQQLADALAAYRLGRKVDARHPSHARYGPADAPLQIVEFTDILCGHCRNLSDTMRMLKRVVPQGSISVEPRYYPLDPECNKSLSGAPRDDAPHVRCVGAKAQICLEKAPDFWEVRERLFEQQGTLRDADRVLEIASSGSVSRPQLEACVKSPETETRLQEDIAYANEYGLQGTPLVLLNGREGFPFGTFLYAMALTRGDPDAAVFKELPPPTMVHE